MSRLTLWSWIVLGLIMAGTAWCLIYVVDWFARVIARGQGYY